MAHITDRALRIVAEDKIRAAIAAGEFDNIPGLGKPHPIIDEPYDPMWWIRRKLAREQIKVTLIDASRVAKGSL